MKPFDHTLKPRKAALALFGALLALVTASAVFMSTAQGATRPKPTDLQGEAVSTGLKIWWTAPDTSGTDVVGTLVGYVVQRRYGDPQYVALAKDVAADTTEYIDTSGGSTGSFIARQAYQYRVKAIYETADGTIRKSGGSDHVTVWVPAYLSPSNFAVTFGTDGATLTWDEPTISWSSGRAALTGYEIEAITNLQTQRISVGSDLNTYVDEDATVSPQGYGSTYYKIAAVYGVFRTWAFSASNVTIESSSNVTIE